MFCYVSYDLKLIITGEKTMKITGNYELNHPKLLVMDDEFFGAKHKTSDIMSERTSGCGLVIKIKKIISKLLGIRNVPSSLQSPKMKADTDYASAVNRGLLNTPKYHLGAKNSSEQSATQTVYNLYQHQQRMVE